MSCLIEYYFEYFRYLELGIEYQENRDEFNRKALEYVKKHALARE